MLQNRLKELRTQKGISQRALGEILNMSQQAIAKWEIGTASPDPVMLNKIADYFNVTVDYLTGHTNIKNLDKPIQTVSEDDIKVALFGGSGEVTDEMWDEVKNFAEFVKKKNKK